MNNPLVSIIVSCNNQAQYLGEVLQLVLARTYSNWLCIFVNDKSLGNKIDVAKKYNEIDERFNRD